VWERWPLILGVALVLVVLFLRGGLVEALARLRDAAGGPRPPRRRPDERVPSPVVGEAGS
jgi:hypothetical protein